jgi:hypothetical protein
MPTTTETVFRHSDSLVTRDLAGEKVIIPVRGRVGDLGCIYTLNRIANEVWNLIDSRHSVADIVHTLEAEYDVDPAILAADVNRLLDEFLQEGLIVLRTLSGDQG